MLPSENVGRPTCGVVIEKNGEQEKICPEFASVQVTLTDPDEPTRVSAILLVCSRHSQLLDEGEEFIFLADNKVDHIGVRYGETSFDMPEDNPKEETL